MHTARFFIALGMCLVSYACGGAHFDVASAGQAQIASGQALGNVPLSGMNPLVITDNTVLKNQSIGLGRIANAHATQITLAVDAASGSADLTFLTEATVVIEAAGLAPVTVASTVQFPASQNLVPLEVSDKVDLATYLRAKNCTLSLVLAGTAVDHAVTLHVDVQLTIDADNRAVLFE